MTVYVDVCVLVCDCHDLDIAPSLRPIPNKGFNNNNNNSNRRLTIPATVNGPSKRQD